MIYGDFENVLVPKNIGKQSPHESYTNNYPNHVAFIPLGVSVKKSHLFSICPKPSRTNVQPSIIPHIR